MKKRTVAIACMIAGLLIACNPIQAGARPDSSHLYIYNYPERVSVFTDPATGCQYLVISGADGYRYHPASMTPRLNLQGRPICLSVH